MFAICETDGMATKKDRTRDRHAPNRTLRVPLELYDQLSQAALANERPVHWEARIALRAHLARHQKRKSPSDTGA